MSTEAERQDEQDVTSQDVDMLQDTPVKPTYKSFKKKYRKIMVNFDGKMKESNNMFREEQRMMDISRRLAEQNDQLLELLYDLNNCPELSPKFRYELDVNGSAIDETPISNYDAPAAHSVLKEARQELRNGEISAVDYKRLEMSLLHNRAFAPANDYNALRSIPHTQEETADELSLRDGDGNTGYVSPRHEEQYMQDLDTFLAGDSSTRRPSSYANLARSGDRVLERDRDTALRNPVSVYNWLRKHQPQVFLQDKENDGEKAAARSSGTGRSSKRGSIIKQEPEMYDEDGIALEPKASARGKRKRDDDSGYRPKGGGTRSAKRKRDEGTSRRNSKKIETPG